ncbi:protein lysine acetyltransferase, partial [Salmonella enterica subsp. enterica serovar Heidelberg str. RI-11-013374]
GKLAFISQSAAVSNTILDWAQQREMGFSYFIALGDSLDIDVDELLDYLARDSKTSAILLYLEQLSDARRFVSAARSASRNKPILVIKSGRSPAAQRLLNTSAGMDPAWDAAIQRAGLLRVQDTHELFFRRRNTEPYASATRRQTDDHQQWRRACRAGVR